MCLNLMSTWDIGQPSGDEQARFSTQTKTAGTECMLRVVPGD